MSATTPALLAAAAGVGFGHAILPDHWVPLAVIARTRRYPMTRVARLSWIAGVAHVGLSIVLGAAIIVIGLQFQSTVQSAQDTIIGGLLIATGIGFVVLELGGFGHGHGHDHGHGHAQDDGHAHGAHDHDREGEAHEPGGHEHTHEPEGRGLRGLAAVMVPFGAAASPDLTILPVFLAATTAGVLTAIGSVLVFAAVTIGTIVGLTLAAAKGGYQIRGRWLDRWGNTFTAAVLVAIGVLILTGVV